LPRLNFMLTRKKILKLKIRSIHNFIYDYTSTYTSFVKIPSQISDTRVDLLDSSFISNSSI